MAEPNNHAELKGSIAGQSFSLNTKEIIPVLLLLGGIIGGYLIFVALDHRITMLIDGQERLLTAVAASRAAMVDALHEYRSFIVEQVNASHQRLDARDQDRLARRANDLDVIQQMLRIHEYNMNQEPDKRLPLDLAPGSLPHTEPKR
jgi:hypothetical protein